MERSERYVYIVVILVLMGAAIAAFIVDGVSVLGGVIAVQSIPARLIQDFAGSVGVGAALLNAVLVATIGFLLVRFNNIRLSGPTIAAIFTMLGFGLFGKTVVNAVPIIFGVFIAARFAGKQFNEYILIALFGTALGPIVTAIAFEIAGGYWPVVLAVVGGIGIGFLLPAAAIAMLRMHQGYSLYNIGLTSGFLGIFAAALLRAGGTELAGVPGWFGVTYPVFEIYLVVLSVGLLVVGIAMAGTGCVKDLRSIMKLSGRLPSDFLDLVSPGGGLCNMGVMGLATWALLRIIDAPINGPVLGAALTIIGFASFGKHLRNVWPVVLGAIGASLLFGYPITSAGPLLAILFVTTLAPLSGDFGPIVGLIAGVVHLTLVLQTGAWHGGIALYNNGFAGGLTATLILATIEWYRSTHDETFRRWRGDKR